MQAARRPCRPRSGPFPLRDSGALGLSSAAAAPGRATCPGIPPDSRHSPQSGWGAGLGPPAGTSGHLAPQGAPRGSAPGRAAFPAPPRLPEGRRHPPTCQPLPSPHRGLPGDPPPRTPAPAAHSSRLQDVTILSPEVFGESLPLANFSFSLCRIMWIELVRKCFLRIFPFAHTFLENIFFPTNKTQ